MVGDDCPVKVKKDIKEEIDELRFVMRKKSLSQVIATLLLFYKDNKKTFKEWKKKRKNG